MVQNNKVKDPSTEKSYQHTKSRCEHLSTSASYTREHTCIFQHISASACIHANAPDSEHIPSSCYEQRTIKGEICFAVFFFSPNFALISMSFICFLTELWIRPLTLHPCCHSLPCDICSVSFNMWLRLLGLQPSKSDNLILHDDESQRWSSVLNHDQRCLNHTSFRNDIFNFLSLYIIFLLYMSIYIYTHRYIYRYNLYTSIFKISTLSIN